MISIDHSDFLLPTKEFRRLSVMLAIHRGKGLSQHRIAKETKLSSSMVNNYIKELSAKQHITVSQKNKRDMDYLLTPNGRTELMRLLVQYSAEIVRLYGQAKTELTANLQRIFNGGPPRRVVLYGGAETGDLVYQVLREIPSAQIIGVVDGDPAKHHAMFHGFELQPPDALADLRPELIIITSFAQQDAIYKQITHLEKTGVQIQKLSSL